MKLKSISVSGYKTIRQLSEFEPKSLNILIGVNGAGKSNFIGFFRFLQWMLTPPGQLQWFVRDNGGAASFLHYGQRTREISARLELETDVGNNEYAFRLFSVSGDMFAFAEEKYRFSRSDFQQRAPWIEIQPGRLEAGLNARVEEGDRTARAINGLIRGCVVHQFHNTSPTSRIKQSWSQDDNYYLKEDGANLAPFLRRLKDHEPGSYKKIVETIRIVFPLFADFVLNPVGRSILLQWKELGQDTVFSSYQASDGLLRFFALAALLLQPQQTMPDVLLIDEPELGLHPHALEILAGLLQTASITSQVIVSTQSAPLLSQFDAGDIVVVDRKNGESTFRRLDEAELTNWLEDYTIGDLWQKNYIEGASNG